MGLGHSLTDLSLSPASSLLDFGTMASVPGSGRESSMVPEDPESFDGRAKFAALLRKYRRRLSVNRRDLGRRVGVTMSAVRRWERLEALPSEQVVGKVLLELRLTVSERSEMLSAWELGRSVRRTSELPSIVKIGKPNCRKGVSKRTPESIRDGTRDRVRILRDRRLLESEGLPEGSTAFLEAREVLRASGWREGTPPPPAFKGRRGEMVARAVARVSEWNESHAKPKPKPAEPL